MLKPKEATMHINDAFLHREDAKYEEAITRMRLVTDLSKKNCKNGNLLSFVLQSLDLL